MVMEMPSAQCVGQEFVRQYYTLLHEAPNFMHRFYSHDSSFVHGGIEKPGEELPPVMGQTAIHKKIMSLNFRDCHAKIRQVDSQATIGNAVVVQVVGELSNAGQPMRRFMQTFVLAPQSPKKYYVHNDIFRYQDEVFHESLIDGETDSADHEAVDGYEESDNSQCVPIDECDQHLMPTSNGSPSVDVIVGRVPEPVLELENENLESPVKEPTSCVELQPAESAVVAEQSPDGAHLSQVGGGPAPTHFQPNVVTPSPVPSPESTGVQTHQTAAPPTHSNITPQQQPTEIKAPEPAKQVSWAALASKGTASASVYPTQPKPQATVKPELKPEPPVSAPLPQRAPRVDRGSVDRENVIGGVGVGSGTSGTDGEESTRRNRYPDNLQVFVGNLPHNFTEPEMREYFEKYGSVTDVRINRRATRDVPNFGFVVFDTPETVQKVLSARPLYIFDDKYRLNVEEKKQQTDYRPGGGMPRGSPRGGFRGGFGGPRGNGGPRGGWRGGRGGTRGGMSYGAGRTSDDDNSGDDRNYERPSHGQLQ